MYIFRANHLPLRWQLTMHQGGDPQSNRSGSRRSSTFPSAPKNWKAILVQWVLRWRHSTKYIIDFGRLLHEFADRKTARVRSPERTEEHLVIAVIWSLISERRHGTICQHIGEVLSSLIANALDQSSTQILNSNTLLLKNRVKSVSYIGRN